MLLADLILITIYSNESLYLVYEIYQIKALYRIHQSISYGNAAYCPNKLQIKLQKPSKTGTNPQIQ